MNHMTPSLVTPGMNVSSAAECEAGEGTIEVDGRIIATAIGAFSIQDGIGTVTAATPIVTPEVGDTVLCEIVQLNETNGEAQVICIEGNQVWFYHSTVTVNSMSPTALIATCIKPPTPYGAEMYVEPK